MNVPLFPELIFTIATKVQAVKGVGARNPDVAPSTTLDADVTIVLP